MRPLLVTGAISALLSGCAGLEDYDDRAPVSEGLEERTGSGIGPRREPGEVLLPEGIALEDGITEDEAVALALWNNAAFQEALADLGFARADLIEAGLLKNPVLSVLFPVGPKQLEFAATLPLEILWLRWSRKEIARLELERVSSTLVQNGLNLVRDARSAHAHLILREAEAGFSEQSAERFEGIAEYFASRLKAGDVSELEAGLARVDALNARREAERLRVEVAAQRERFRELLGLVGVAPDWRIIEREARPLPKSSADDLLKQAWAARPDLRAAELALERAGERAGLARWECFLLSGIVDANDRKGKEGLEVGPGLQTTVPIFNWNQGGKALADAGVNRAALGYVTIRHAIAREVGEALARNRQAQATLDAYREGIVPGLEDALERARKAADAGQTSILPVLRTELRLIDARAREAEALAGARAARAELERSVGSRLETEDRR